MDNRYYSTLKHKDVEEPIDLWFYRPMGFRLALLGEKYGWTPNLISIISIFLGVGAGLLFYPQDWRWNLVGMIFLVMADICDSADGQLARMTNQYSRLGRILDGASGDVWFLSIYVCISLRLQPEWGWLIWVLSLSAGYCHGTQAALADYYRQFHLFFVKGKEGSEWDDSSHVEEEYNRNTWSQSALYKAFLWVYLRYTRSQESATPNLQAFRKLLVSKPKDEALYESVIAESRPLMKYCNILTFNCRAITLFISLMLGMPWLYFMVELTLGDILYLYLWRKHEKMCARYVKAFQE